MKPQTPPKKRGASASTVGGIPLRKRNFREKFRQMGIGRKVQADGTGRKS